MASESSTVDLDRRTPEEMESTMGSIKKMLLVGGAFAAVGYLLVVGALVLELTQFHPLIEQFFTQHPEHSIAGGGPGRAGSAALNADLAAIHQFPSTLLWMKLGGIAHVLVGIFIALAAIIRALALMPHRLSYELASAE
ncbi:MAG: hypothetical protein V5A33_06975 [Halobacteriales archaeon]